MQAEGKPEARARLFGSTRSPGMRLITDSADAYIPDVVTRHVQARQREIPDAYVPGASGFTVLVSFQPSTATLRLASAGGDIGYSSRQRTPLAAWTGM